MDIEFTFSPGDAKGNAFVSLRNDYTKLLGMIVQSLLVLLISFTVMCYASFLFVKNFTDTIWLFFFLIVPGSDLFLQCVNGSCNTYSR